MNMDESSTTQDVQEAAVEHADNDVDLRRLLQRRGERMLSPADVEILGTLATQAFCSKSEAVQAARDWASRLQVPSPIRVASNDRKNDLERKYDILPPFRMGCVLHKKCKMGLRFVREHVFEDARQYHWVVSNVVAEHSSGSEVELTAEEALSSVLPRRNDDVNRVTAPEIASSATASTSSEDQAAVQGVGTHVSLREFPKTAVNVALSIMTVAADLRGQPSVRGGCDVHDAIMRLHARQYQADLSSCNPTNSARLVRAVSTVLRDEFRGGSMLPVDDRVEFVKLLEKRRSDGDLVRFQDLSPSGNFRWAAWVPARSMELVDGGFADVVAFDTTYQTNAYGLPLVLVVGLTCARKVYTIAAAVMTGETTEQYEEVLSWLAEAVPSLRPESVIIDDSAAERGAIRRAWPTAAPVTCSWHVKTALIAALHRRVDDSEKTQIGARWEAVCRADTPVLLGAAWARFLELFELTPADIPFDLSSAETPVSDAGPRAKLKQILRSAATWQGMAVRTAFTAGMKASSIAEGEFARVKAELLQPGAHTRTLVGLLTVLASRLNSQGENGSAAGATAFRRGIRAGSLTQTGAGPLGVSYVQFDSWAKSVLWKPMYDQCSRAQAQCHVYNAVEFDNLQAAELHAHIDAFLSEQQEKYVRIGVARDQARVAVAAEAAALAGEQVQGLAADEDPRTDLIVNVDVQAYLVTNQSYAEDWRALCEKNELDPAATFMCDTTNDDRPVVRLVPCPRVVQLVAAKTHGGDIHYGVVCSCLGPTNGGVPCSHGMAVYSAVCRAGGQYSNLLECLRKSPTKIIQSMIHPRWYMHKDLRNVSTRQPFTAGRTIAMDLLLRLLRHDGQVAEQALWSVPPALRSIHGALPALTSTLNDRDRVFDGPLGRPTLQGGSRTITYRRVVEYLKQQAGQIADVIHRGNVAAEDMLRAHMDSVVRSVAIYADSHPRARLPPETQRPSEMSVCGRVANRKTITARGVAARKKARKDERARVAARVVQGQPSKRGRGDNGN